MTPTYASGKKPAHSQLASVSAAGVAPPSVSAVMAKSPSDQATHPSPNHSVYFRSRTLTQARARTSNETSSSKPATPQPSSQVGEVPLGPRTINDTA